MREGIRRLLLDALASGLLRLRQVAPLQFRQTFRRRPQFHLRIDRLRGFEVGRRFVIVCELAVENPTRNLQFRRLR